MHSDLFITKLVYTYIFYGLHFKKNFFVNLFWYPLLKKQVLNFENESNLKYFRMLEYRNKVFNEISFIKLRKKKKTAYLSRFWILKFQNWVVVNLYMFQPYKTKRRKKKKFYAKTAFLNSTKPNASLQSEILLRKHVLARKFYFTLLFANTNYYTF